MKEYLPLGGSQIIENVRCDMALVHSQLYFDDLPSIILMSEKLILSQILNPNKDVMCMMPKLHTPAAQIIIRAL